MCTMWEVALRTARLLGLPDPTIQGENPRIQHDTSVQSHVLGLQLFAKLMALTIIL
jgi:hypothetical protein